MRLAGHGCRHVTALINNGLSQFPVNCNQQHQGRQLPNGVALSLTLGLPDVPEVKARVARSPR